MIQWKWELNTADDDNDLQQNTDEKKKNSNKSVLRPNNPGSQRNQNIPVRAPHPEHMQPQALQPQSIESEAEQQRAEAHRQPSTTQSDGEIQGRTDTEVCSHHFQKLVMWVRVF